MSHPISSRTYEDDLMSQWTDEEIERLFELYKLECRRTHTRPTMSDFMIYLQERV